jgi:hypothetical protein
MLVQLKEGNITDPISGEFSPTFYRNIDREDMLKDLLKKYVYKKHTKDYAAQIWGRLVQRYYKEGLNL